MFTKVENNYQYQPNESTTSQNKESLISEDVPQQRAFRFSFILNMAKVKDDKKLNNISMMKEINYSNERKERMTKAFSRFVQNNHLWDQQEEEMERDDDVFSENNIEVFDQVEGEDVMFGRKKRDDLRFSDRMRHFNACIKSGWLTFHSQNLLKKKKNLKWCVFHLVDNIIQIYSSPEDQESKKCIVIDQISSVSEDIQNDEKCMRIEMKEGKILHISCENDEELSDWLGIIEFAQIFLDSSSLKQYAKENNYDDTKSISMPFDIEVKQFNIPKNLINNIPKINQKYN